MASLEGLGLAGQQQASSAPLSSSAQLYQSNNPNAIQATISRLQFEDYKNRFRPLEDRLFAAAETPIAPTYANRDLIAGIGARDRSRYGVSLDSGEAANLNRGLDLAATLADVGAENTARTATRDQRLNMLTDITGLGRDVVVQSGQSASAAAQMASQRKAQNDAIKSQQLGQTISSIGTGAGLGYAGAALMGVTGPQGALIGAGAGLILDSLF